MDSSPPLSGYRLPAWLLVLYAVLLFALGWIASGVWDSWRSPKHEVQDMPSGVTAGSGSAGSGDAVPACQDDVLTPLRYSAHIWADAPAQRSVTLNGTQYREGDTLPCGEEVAQIEPTALVLESLGRRMRLDALWDWPGGPVAGIVLPEEDAL